MIKVSVCVGMGEDGEDGSALVRGEVMEGAVFLKFFLIEQRV